jgi:uncharacterized DUF497 family protein
MYEWNEIKRKANLAKHGVDFTAIEAFAWEEALVIPDTRKDYGEPRFLAFGPIDDRLHCLAFSVRGGSIRVISLRKANRREVKRYG